MKLLERIKIMSVCLSVVGIAVLLTVAAFTIPTGSATNYHNAKVATEWANSVENPENAEFVVEVAFNEDIDTSEVTQQMFNNRYSNN